MAIPIARPAIGEDEVAAVADVLRSGWVTQGPKVAEFERAFAEFVGAEHACAVSSCTTALHLALLAVGVEPGDEVITVSHSFIATANSVRYCGATPVFVDIDPGTFNIDPGRVAALVGERTRAVLCVHQMGMPCDLAALGAICARHGLPLVEDAACAAGSEFLNGDQWERIGKPYGDIACFSFHPRKVLTTGDGGMLTTSNPEWDQRFREMRQHCMTVPDTARHAAKQVVFEQYARLGYNYRMTDIQAAVGLVQLARLPELVAERRSRVQRYRTMLGNAPELVLPHEPDGSRSNWQSFCVRLPSGVDQRGVMQSMLDAGVASRRGIMCAHLEPAYTEEPWGCAGRAGGCECPVSHCEQLSVSESAQDRCIVLPLFPGMTDPEQDAVVTALLAACGG